MLEIDVTLDNQKTTKPQKGKKRIKPFRIFSCLLIPLLLFGGGGYYLYRLYTHYAQVNQAKVQADIASNIKEQGLVVPSSDAGDPFARHPEAFAIIPYDHTVYDSIVNYVFNFQFRYPKNTSALIRNAGGDQLWLLRQEAYMFSITITQSTMKIQDYYNTLAAKTDYTATKVKYAEKDALFLQLVDQTRQITGNQYIVANKGYIFLIWYRTFKSGEDPDDDKRIQDILKSFSFI